MDTSANPQYKTYLAVILVALVLILIGAFMLLDFHVVRGQANSGSQVSTYTFSIDEDSKLPLNQTLDVYVLGNGGLERELAAALERSLLNPYVSRIEIRQGSPESAARGVLVVELTKPDLIWTPVYSRTDIEMLVAYASDGEVDWIDEDPVNLTNAQPVVRVRGDYQMQASATGIMSLPGFKTYTAQQLADQIAASLMERLTSANDN